jgi:enoyl-CoA hydratase/carnithine racemase
VPKSRSAAVTPEAVTPERVTINLRGGVADVRLNRPEKMNALDPAMFKALIDVSDELAQDASLRCVVLSGEGRSFCAGLDFSSFQGMADEDSDRPAEIRDITAADEGRITHRGQQAVYGWTSMPVPVVAAIEGHALGGGIQLALGADIRVISPGAKMSVLESRWGLVPDMTGTQSLIKLVGLDVAKELTFTGRMVGGAEAVELGLATHLADDPHTMAMELAHDVASKSPDAIRATKRLFNEASKVSTADGFAAERAEIGKLIGSPNQVESVMAFFEKRQPNFADPS